MLPAPHAATPGSVPEPCATSDLPSPRWPGQAESSDPPENRLALNLTGPLRDDVTDRPSAGSGDDRSGSVQRRTAWDGYGGGDHGTGDGAVIARAES